LCESCPSARSEYLVEEGELLVELVIGFPDTGAPKRTATEQTETGFH
jgi:hypothetical protein